MDSGARTSAVDHNPVALRISGASGEEEEIAEDESGGDGDGGEDYEA